MGLKQSECRMQCNLFLQRENKNFNSWIFPSLFSYYLSKYLVLFRRYDFLFSLTSLSLFQHQKHKNPLTKWACPIFAIIDSCPYIECQIISVRNDMISSVSVYGGSVVVIFILFKIHFTGANAIIDDTSCHHEFKCVTDA